MAGRNQGQIPVPPPVPGIFPIDDHDMHQVPTMDVPQNVPQNMPQRRVPPTFQRPVPQQRPFAQYGPGMTIKNSIRTSDIRPRKELSEDYCREQLTTYQVCAIKKRQPQILDADDKTAKKKESRRRSSFGFKDSKDSKKPKLTWEVVDFTNENFSNEEVIKKIQRLDRKLPVTDKVNKLKPNQSRQLAHLTDDIVNSEHDQWFEWTLAQLERSEIKNSKGERETERITCYFKRSPRPVVDVVAMYQETRNRPNIIQPFPPRPNPQYNGNPNQQSPPVNMGTYQGTRGGGMQAQDPRRGQMRAPIEIVQERDKGRNQRGNKNGSRPRSNRSDSSSDSETDSQTDADSIYGSDTDPSSHGSASRRNGNGRYFNPKDKFRRHHDHEPEIVLVERSRRHHDAEPEYTVVDQSRRHSSIPYVPDVPRQPGPRPAFDENVFRSAGIDIPRSSVADIFAAGVLAAAQVSNRLPSTSPGSTRQQLLNDRDSADRLLEEGRRRDLVDEIINRESTVSPRQTDVEEMLSRREARRVSEFSQRPSAAILDDEFERRDYRRPSEYSRRFSSGILDDEYERRDSRRPSEFLRRSLTGIPDDDYERRDARRLSEFPRGPSMGIPENDFEYVRNPMSPRDQPTFRHIDRFP